jgi:hypothetical protein
MLPFGVEDVRFGEAKIPLLHENKLHNDVSLIF